MGRLDDAMKAAVERKNAVVERPDGEAPEFDIDIMRLIFADFDIDFKELEQFIRLAIEHGMARIDAGETPVDAIGDTVTNCLLTGLYHERMRANDA